MDRWEGEWVFWEPVNEQILAVHRCKETGFASQFALNFFGDLEALKKAIRK